MTYMTTKNKCILDALGHRIEDFARRYRPGRPTVVLLPGGMGSQLDRSIRPYRKANDKPFERYDPIWMDLGIVFGKDAVKLKIQDSGRDADDHIIIPDGPLDFIVNAYNGTEQYFRDDRGWNYICFGFDWRRPVTESAGYLESFLRRLGARVNQLMGESPLPNTTLLCHSMGGLVAVAFLHRIAKQAKTIDQWLARVVTVGTPFYGTATHIRRYFKGQNFLNRLYGRTCIARLAGTLPGPYALLFPSIAQYSRDAQRLAQSKYRLDRYPMRDAGQRNLAIDPFGQTAADRFPSWVSPSHLRSADKMRTRITGPLPQELTQRMFHIRSGLVQMPIEQKWRAVKGANFDPEYNVYPIQKAREGPGDGTVPAWSARLVGTPLAQVYNLTKARNHSELAEHLETLEVVSALMTHGKLPKRLQVQNTRLGSKKAPAGHVKSFMDGVLDGQIDRNSPEASNPELWRPLMEEVNFC